MSQWVCFLTYIWMGKCLLTLPSEFSLLDPGPNEEWLFLAASMAAKRSFTTLPLKWWSKALTGVLGGSGSLENPHPHPLWEVLFLKLYSHLHQCAEETSFLQKVVFPPTAGGNAVKGKWELGIILANVLSTSDKNV